MIFCMMLDLSISGYQLLKMGQIRVMPTFQLHFTWYNQGCFRMVPLFNNKSNPHTNRFFSKQKRVINFCKQHKTVQSKFVASQCLGVVSHRFTGASIEQQKEVVVNRKGNTNPIVSQKNPPLKVLTRRCTENIVRILIYGP